MTGPQNYIGAPARPASPCINICSLDEHGECRGCYRTIREITEWSRLTSGQQWAIIEKLVRRAETKAGAGPRAEPRVKAPGSD
jgi:predicted Fe-S protein YdhL (DUF1289 family)